MARRRRGRGEGAVFYSESKRGWIGRAVIGVKPSGKPLVKEVMARTKGEVLAKMRKAEEDAREGRIGDAAKMTTGQYLEHWLNNVAKPTVGLSTWRPTSGACGCTSSHASAASCSPSCARSTSRRCSPRCSGTACRAATPRR